MIIEDTVEFLGEVPPLSYLDPARLRALAGRASLEFHPRGAVALGPGGAGEGFVHVVKKGVLQDGEVRFGPGAVLGWTSSRAMAAEDCVCVLLPPEAVGEALKDRPELFDFLEERLSAAVLELGLDGLARDLPARLFRRPLARVTAGEAARGGEPLAFDTPIREAARIMTESASDAALVLGRGGRPSGVVTDRDFRCKAVERGLPPETPVGEIMSSPLVSVDASDSCFEALMAMTRHHLRHVVVMAGLRPAGVLSAKELLLRQVGSPPVLAARVAGAASVEELTGVPPLLDRLALDLLREGARPATLGRAVGGLREALAARVCCLGEAALGPPPAGYVLMLVGPAARREGPALLPLWTALVYEDAPGAGAWCARLGEFLAQALGRMGLAGGSDDPSAGNAAWRGTAGRWRERLEAWSAAGTSDAAGSSVRPCPDHWDFRPVHGRLGMAEELRAYLSGLARAGVPVAGVSAALPAPCPEEPGPDGQEGTREAPPIRQDEAGRDDPGETLACLVRSWSLRLGISRISSLERAMALTRVLNLGPELVHALEYQSARRWAGGAGRSSCGDSPLARAMERMCRLAARRAHDGMVAFFGS